MMNVLPDDDSNVPTSRDEFLSKLRALLAVHRVDSPGYGVPDQAANTASVTTLKAANDNDSALLQLPGELRNRIYRLVLCQEKQIIVTRLNWSSHQPALLQTNRQIRNEAIGVFYHGNAFCVAVHDWNGSLLERFRDLRSVYKSNAHWRHYFTGGPHWANLLEWLKGVHGRTRRSLRTPGLNQVRPALRWVLAACFETAQNGRAMPWSTVERILGVQRKALIALDSRWGLDRQ